MKRVHEGRYDPSCILQRGWFRGGTDPGMFKKDCDGPYFEAVEVAHMKDPVVRKKRQR